MLSNFPKPKKIQYCINIKENQQLVLAEISKWGDSVPEKKFLTHVTSWNPYINNLVDIYAQVSLDGIHSYDFCLVFEDRWVMYELDSRKSNKQTFEKKDLDALHAGFFMVRVPAVGCTKKEQCLQYLDFAMQRTQELDGRLSVIRPRGYTRAVKTKKRFKLPYLKKKKRR